MGMPLDVVEAPQAPWPLPCIPGSRRRERLLRHRLRGRMHRLGLIQDLVPRVTHDDDDGLGALRT
eukprot:6458581-Heterocapsa_arctica.AAC.1